MHLHTYHCITGFHNRFLIFSLFISAEMALEQTVKDLQTQNAQFQEMILNLAKGQEELKALITKEKKKKTKKSAGILNMGRRFRGPVKQVQELEVTADKDDETDEDDKSVNTEGKSNHGFDKYFDGEEEDYLDEQYPPADEKYKLLEERLKAMEIQKVPGLNFEDLGLVSGVVIPPKFKIPAFAKYDGVSCPKLHLRSYVRRIQPHTADKKLWMHFFQESLSGAQLEWYYQLESTNIHTWEDLATAFYKQYQYNADLTPTRMQLQSMSMGSNESFKEYA